MKKKNFNLGVFLSPGDSLQSLRRSGQDVRFLQEYWQRYIKHFKQVYIFSYSSFIHRFLYQFLIPFIYLKKIKKVDICRVMQLTGTVPAILARIFFGKPFVFTYGYDYASFAQLEGKKIRSILFRPLEKLAVKFCSAVIVTHPKMQPFLQQKYPQVNLFYLPNGVNIRKFKAKRVIAEKLSQKPINILFIGRLEKQKNLESLIRAAVLLKDQFEIRLTFIGQGSLKLQLIKLASQLGVELRIIDRVGHDKLPFFYQKADIFCLPSFLEGQPKVLLEAMASSLPCLVARYPGVEEFKNKKEILLSGFQAQEIAKGLKLILKNHILRNKLSQNARKLVVKKFNLDQLLSEEIKLLKQLAKHSVPTIQAD